MNTQEKYLAGYILETLTGIKGDNQEWVYQVIEKGDFKMSDPFLQLVYDIAKQDPRSQATKDIVSGIVIGATLLSNETIQKAMEMTIEEAVQEELAKPKDKPEYKNILLCHFTDEGKFYGYLWYKGTYVGKVVAPEKAGDEILKSYKQRFPSAKLSNLSE